MRSSLLQRILLSAALSLPLATQAAVKTGEPGELRDLHYGEVLFQLYQEHYFEAIVHLLSARKKGLMKAYEDEPELLLGGLYLAYGMPDPAESLFQRVLEKSASAELQSRAWLQLAKSRHRRDDGKAAESALKRVGNGLKPNEKDESINLLGLIQLQRQEDSAALTTLEALSGKNDWSLYGQFNLAIAHIRRGERDKGLSMLHEIGTSDTESDEMKAIRDRANLLLGYLMLEAKQPDKALEALQRVRLHGPSSSQALLGAGWASLQQNEPKQALVPWQMLAQRNTSDPAVLEVQLAIPYALAQLQAEQQSLQGYKSAIDRFSSSIGELDSAMQSIRQSSFPDSLLNDAGKPGGENSDDTGLRGQLPILLSRNDFQERLQDYHDLRQLERNLQQWQEKITAYQSMLEVRRQAFAKVNPKVDAFLAGDTLNQLQRERDDLQSLYERAASPEEPPFILTTGEEKASLERLDSIHRLIDEYNANGRLEAQKEEARLMEGILIWRTVTEHPARLWELKKQMAGLDLSLKKTRKLMADLALAREQTRNRFADYSTRIGALQKDIPAMLRKATALRGEEAKKLQDMAIAVLEQRKTLLHDYLIQARFGVASLLDSSSASNTEGTKQ